MTDLSMRLAKPPLLAVSILSTLFFNGHCAAEPVAQAWAKLTLPTHTPPKSIGSYTSGCLSGAAALPSSGPGYQVMRLSRNRYFGHPLLVEFIQHLGQESATAHLGTLLIGDLSQARGGPTPSGHRSHQTGLDVDIWFLLPNNLDNRLLTENERETWGAPSMLDVSSNNLDYRQWSIAQESILSLAARHPEVERIFVNPSIKRELCNHKTTSSSSWLRKIRPWWKHDDHFHVRLKCPADSPDCAQQEPLPEGDGCDAGLDWWFSAEANAPSAHKPAAPLKLPAACNQLMQL